MILEQLRRLSLVYVGSPYTKFHLGHEAAFQQAAQITGALMMKGVKVYSPITHGHPLSVHGGVPFTDHDVWMPFDRAMMDKSDALIVAKMDRWERSEGVDHEIHVFIEAGKPIYFINPDTLEFDGDECATAS